MNWLFSWLRMQRVPHKEPPAIRALLCQLDEQQETARGVTEKAKQVAKKFDLQSTMDGIAKEL